MRAILGLPLGGTAPVGHCGDGQFHRHVAGPRRVLAIPGAHFHLYDKAPRPGRKLGHCTVVAGSAVERDRTWRKVRARLPATLTRRCRAGPLPSRPAAGPPTAHPRPPPTGLCDGARGFEPHPLPYSTGQDRRTPMYLEHFKLKELPFRLSPDPAVPVTRAQVHSARQGVHGIDDLVHGRLCRDHGRVGAGKTTLIESFLQAKSTRTWWSPRSTRHRSRRSSSCRACWRSSASARSACARPASSSINCFRSAISSQSVLLSLLYRNPSGNGIPQISLVHHGWVGCTMKWVLNLQRMMRLVFGYQHLVQLFARPDADLVPGSPERASQDP